ncbi:MAG: 23S rRNA (adenine(2503)-C(8))-methyltransferase Cfr [Anaerolineales bacterium]|nr:23S rRNA (adenine(2503)-C(8))-methyltransferase Cfr [Anaerolineales bacterium]
MPRVHRYAQIQEALRQLGAAPYRFQQILEAVFRQHVLQFSAMPALPGRLRTALAEQFGDSLLALRSVQSSQAAQADKHLFALEDGRRIEAVAMRYRAGWHSYCLSTQAGCGFGCRFCATAAMRLQRNLSADEICDQALYFRVQGQPLDSISFMGMGEALANPNLFTALECLTHSRLFALSPRRLTVSTIGLVPAMRQLTEQHPQVNLTFSLHSPFNEQRSQLIPLNRKYPIEDVLDALDAHVAHTHRKVYMAYLLLEGVNDSRQHAAALAERLHARGRQTRLFHVNLLRHNANTFAAERFARPSEAHIHQFRDWLEQTGLKVTVRSSFGDEIQAACGQLHASAQEVVVD